MLLNTTIMIIVCYYVIGGWMTSNLAKEDGHEVIVEQEGFGEAWIVELEEEDGEAKCDVLLRRCAEG